MHVVVDGSITTVGPPPAAIDARVRWGAVSAGALIAAGPWLLLHTLGLADGLGKLMLGLVLALALGLTAAVLGALLGARERVARVRS